MIYVAPRPVTKLDKLPELGLRYDAVIGTLGYERRSARIPSALADRTKGRFLIDMDSTGEGSYDRNHEEMRERWTLLDNEPVHLVAWIEELIARLLQAGTQQPRLALDVSSLSRNRIASIVEGIAGLGARPGCNEGRIEVDFLYTPARWRRPGTQPRLTEILGPVTAQFAGTPSDPERPVVAFVGLGFEPDRAVGALEYIEPGDIWAFAPEGEDDRYDLAMRHANDWLFRSLQPSQLLFYDVHDPFACFSMLEQLVFSELPTARPILVPLGPKLFAVCCLLVAALHHRRVGVWRVAPGVYENVVDHDSGGQVISLRATFDRQALASSRSTRYRTAATPL